MADITEPSADRFSVGVALDGAGWHPAAWREAGAQPARLFSAAYWGELAELAEVGGLDYLTIVDALGLQAEPGNDLLGPTEIPPRAAPRLVSGRLDAALLASWIAPRTQRIGLIPTVTTTHTEPFHVATGLQTLDHISLGRAGWQLRISAGAAEAAAFGRRKAPEIDPARIAAGRPDPALLELLDEAADAAEVARRLWDSWEHDAIIRDAETGRFLDRDRLHHVDFEGARFSVIGPSIVPRSPQGQLPVTVLAHSRPVYRLAARAADVVFVTPHPKPSAAYLPSAADVTQIVEEVRSIERELDRERLGLQPLRIVADLVIAFDFDDDSGIDRDEQRKGETGTARVARLDGFGVPLVSDAHLATGSPRAIADLIAEWQARGIDGVRLRPLSNHRDLPAIGKHLLPELRRQGIVTVTRGPVTLRQVFGLRKADNRYGTERSQRTTQAKEYAA